MRKSTTPRRPPPKRPKARRPNRQKPTLTVPQILAWADEFHHTTGRWPNTYVGRIPLTDETWCGIDQALRKGCRGFSPGWSLAKLLALHRGRRNNFSVPKLTECEIVVWAQIHFQRMGKWPTVNSGNVHGLPGENWFAINAALMRGARGLPGGSSLSKLLAAHGLKRHRNQPPALTIEQILEWADEFRKRRGKWPGINSGPVDDSSGETWRAINAALCDGTRGLSGTSSLGALLLTHRNVRNPNYHPDRNRDRRCLPNLNEVEIIRWAKAHFRRTGEWPSVNSGDIHEVSGETWSIVDSALKRGGRGLAGGSSLAQLLEAHGLKRNLMHLPQFDFQKILEWADNFHARHGEWPNKYSGVIDEFPEDNWLSVDTSLYVGQRGLPGGMSLTAFLNEHRGIFKGKSRRPKLISESERLKVEDILRWGKAYRQRYGTWPSQETGPVEDAPGLTWVAVNSALRNGHRGLPGGSSLSGLFREQG